MNSNKSFYLWIRGQKVEVSEEVYRAYIRPVRTEQRKEKYDKRCLLPKTVNGKVTYVRCKGKCEECDKQKTAFMRRIVYLEDLLKEGKEIAEIEPNAEERLLEKERTEDIRSALLKLKEKDRKLIALIYFEGKTQSEAAKILKWDKFYTSRRLAKVLEDLKKILKNF